MKRVLIATVTAGGGHLAAAAALEAAWRQERPDDEIAQVDLVEFFSPLHKKVHARSYARMVERAPELWGLVFNRTDDPKLNRKLNKFRQAFTGPSTARIKRHLTRQKPDVVLCTHYLPLEILTSLSARGRLNPFIVSVVTDFEAHALWMSDCVDLYCVAAEQTKSRLVARGVNPDLVAATGIPIRPEFMEKATPRETRKRLGLRDDQPVLLVLGGGFGWGPVAEILEGLDTVEQRFQTVVVCGRNDKLRRDLAVIDRQHPTHLLGFVSDMHALLPVANLVISKPGGLTTSEALAAGRPMLVINPIPGQEAANSDFLLENGAAVKVNRVEDLPAKVARLLGSPRLRSMARAAKALGRPDSARAVCREVTARLEH